MKYREQSVNDSIQGGRLAPLTQQVTATAQLNSKASIQNTAPDENGNDVILPYLATAGDLREVVQFLKRKPEGASIAEAMDAVRKRLFDPRKVFAYEFWGVVKREDDRLKLSQLGWEFAQRLIPEAEAYRSILASTQTYHSALVWIYEQGHQVVTYLDMGNLWRRNGNSLDTKGEEKFEAYASSFFHLCHAADIGMLTVGRKGQPTRLRIYPEELESYIQRSGQEQEQGSEEARLLSSRAVWRQQSRVRPSNMPRVLISHSRNPKPVERIVDLLVLVGLEYEVIERKQIGNLLVSDDTLQALQRCNAGIFLFSEENFNKPDTGMTPDSLLVEVGAAFVHFDRRVILLLEGKPVLPRSFQELYSFQYESNDLSWEVIVKLVKTIKDVVQ